MLSPNAPPLLRPWFAFEVKSGECTVKVAHKEEPRRAGILPRNKIGRVCRHRRGKVLESQRHLDDRIIRKQKAELGADFELVRVAIRVHRAHRGIRPWRAEVGIIAVGDGREFAVLIVRVDPEVPLARHARVVADLA